MAKKTGKTVVVCFRMDPNDKLQISKEALKLGMTIAEYCQMKMLAETGVASKQPVKKQVVSKTAPGISKTELAKIQSNYEQAAKALIKEISENRWELIQKTKQPEFRRKCWLRYLELLKK